MVSERRSLITKNELENLGGVKANSWCNPLHFLEFIEGNGGLEELGRFHQEKAGEKISGVLVRSPDHCSSKKSQRGGKQFRRSIKNWFLMREEESNARQRKLL